MKNGTMSELSQQAHKLTPGLDWAWGRGMSLIASSKVRCIHIGSVQCIDDESFRWKADRWPNHGDYEVREFASFDEAVIWIGREAVKILKTEADLWSIMAGAVFGGEK